MFRLTVFLFACIFVASMAQRRNDVLPEVRDLCINESNVGAEDLERTENEQLVQTEEGKCYIGCVLKNQFGFMTDGTINDADMQEIIRKYPDPNLVEIYLRIWDICKTEVKSQELCEAGFELQRCFVEQRPRV